MQGMIIPRIFFILKNICLKSISRNILILHDIEPRKEYFFPLCKIKGKEIDMEVSISLIYYPPLIRMGLECFSGGVHHPCKLKGMVGVYHRNSFKHWKKNLKIFYKLLRANPKEIECPESYIVNELFRREMDNLSDEVTKEIGETGKYDEGVSVFYNKYVRNNTVEVILSDFDMNIIKKDSKFINLLKELSKEMKKL